MESAFYVGANALNAIEKWQESHSKNIASDNPGYRKVGVSIAAGASGVLPAQTQSSFESYLSGATPTVEHVTSFEQGPIHHTNNPLNFAINGAEGFFQVQQPDGKVLLTRNGTFHVNNQRQLVDGYGNSVLGQAGPIQVLSDGGPIFCDSEGRLSQGETQLDQLKIGTVENLDSLIRVQNGFLVNEVAGQQVVAVEDISVQQGFLEGSNSSVLDGMTGLIQSTRLFQANQELIKHLAKKDEHVVQTLGNTK